MRVGRVSRRWGVLRGLRRRRAEKGKEAGWAERWEELGRTGMKGEGVGWAGLGWAESSELGLFWTGLQGFG